MAKFVSDNEAIEYTVALKKRISSLLGEHETNIISDELLRDKYRSLKSDIEKDYRLFGLT